MNAADCLAEKAALIAEVKLLREVLAMVATHQCHLRVVLGEPPGPFVPGTTTCGGVCYACRARAALQGERP